MKKSIKIRIYLSKQNNKKRIYNYINQAQCKNVSKIYKKRKEKKELKKERNSTESNELKYKYIRIKK